MACPSYGYVYVDEVENGAFSQASIGAVVCKKDRSPPWIVVSHSIAAVLVARWPGKLWRVTNIDAEGIQQASQHAPYTRAMAVTVCDEVPVALLFGEQGAAVCSIISRASELDLHRVHALAASRHPDAGDAYSRAWDQWMSEPGPSPKHGSPINCGFSVLSRVIRERADSLVGSSAFVEDEEEGETYLEPTWASASSAMLDAAMALGAPKLSDADDQLILLAAWRAVFGDSVCTHKDTDCSP